MDIFGNEERRGLPKNPESGTGRANWGTLMFDVSGLGGSNKPPVQSTTQMQLREKRNAIFRILDCDFSPLQDTFKMINGKIIVKTKHESDVLAGHLNGIPLVPGVVQKGLLTELNGSAGIIYGGVTCIKTTFGRPILPGDSVKLGEEGLQLQNEKLETYVAIEVVPKYISSINFDYDELEEQSLSKEKLDKYLLQTGKFRFGTGFTWIYNEDDGKNPQPGDMFQGYFDIPKDFQFFQEKNRKKIVSPYLIEEFAAQIGSLSIGDKLSGIDEEGKYHESERKILTFNNSICQFSGKPLKLGDSFKLVGRIKAIRYKEGIMRTATLEYTGFDSSLNEIISGEITGNVVALETLKYRINKSLKK